MIHWLRGEFGVLLLSIVIITVLAGPRAGQATGDDPELAAQVERLSIRVAALERLFIKGAPIPEATPAETQPTQPAGAETAEGGVPEDLAGVERSLQHQGTRLQDVVERLTRLEASISGASAKLIPPRVALADDAQRIERRVDQLANEVAQNTRQVAQFASDARGIAAINRELEQLSTQVTRLDRDVDDLRNRVDRVEYRRR